MKSYRQTSSVARPGILAALFVAGLCLATNGFSSHARAEELHLEFLDGLRKKGYYDYALLYIDQIEARADVPGEIKQILPYQRGLTHKESASSYPNPESQQAALNKAAAQLETFLKTHPDHAEAASASNALADILIGKAQVKIWESKSPLTKASPEDLRTEARALVQQARDVFQKAHDEYQKLYETFPKFIAPDEKDQLAARSEAETQYMLAQLNLAKCTFEEAQTYPADDPQYKTLLTKAANEFEAIHQKYRSIVGGLYARMWQGKCFEQQDDIGKALGIYGELLQHGEDRRSATLKILQDQVLHFKLICLNHRTRKDYQLVIDEAGSWLDTGTNRGILSTSTGLGIRWEKVQAHEARANQLEKPDDGKKPDEKAVEQELRFALTDAEYLARFSGQYYDVAQYKIQELKARLGQKTGDPTTFDAAIGLARIQVKDIQTYQNAIDEAIVSKQPPAELSRKREALKAHLRRTSDSLHKALQLVDGKTKEKDINQVRYFLAFVYYKLERSLDAGVIGDFVSTRYLKDDPKTAQDSAKVAMAAYVQAYNAALKRADELPDDATPTEEAGSFEMDQILRVCTMIAKTWPQSDLANSSRMTVGKIYTRRNRPADAADWFSKVPKNAGEYSDAQTAAGQAYWNAYLNSVNLPEDKRPDQATLDKWRDAAKLHLQTGITKVAADTPESADITMLGDLIAAKVTLAQILMNEQKHADAVKLLTEGPHPPVKAIEIQEGQDEQRPAVGVQSARFARFVHQLMLTAHVHLQDIDSALARMKQLEALADEAGSGSATAIYVSLGKQIREELVTQQKAGPPERFDATLKSFDQFLSALLQKKSEMSYGSLQWMGETYLALGDSLKDDPRGKAYYSNSADAYQTILDRAKTDPDPPPGMVGIKLRLAKVRQSAGDYAAALQFIEQILKDYPNALEVQTDAARLLQAWGNSGEGDSYKKLIDAINGVDIGESKKAIWGWGGLGQKLSRQLQNTNRDLQKIQQELDLIAGAEATEVSLSNLKTQLDDQKVRRADQDTLAATQSKIDEIEDAIAATLEWLKLRDKLQQARQSLNAVDPEDKDGYKDAVKAIETLNAKIDNLIINHPPSQKTYARLTSIKKQLEDSENEPNAAEKATLQAALNELRNAVRKPLANVDQKDKLLQQRSALEKKADSPREQLLQAMYNVSETRHQYAMQQSDSKAKVKSLRAAALELSSVPRVVARENISDEWWAKFEALYKQIQTDLLTADAGLPADQKMSAEERSELPKPLTTPPNLTAKVVWLETPRTDIEQIVDRTGLPDDPPAPEEAEAEGLNFVVLGLALIAGLGITGGVIFMMNKGGNQRPVRRTYGSEAPVFGGVGPDLENAPIGPPRSKQQPRSGAKPAQRRPAAGQPAGAGTQPAGQQRPRPKQRPAGSTPRPPGQPQQPSTGTPRPAGQGGTPASGAAPRPRQRPQGQPPKPGSGGEPPKRQPPRPRPPQDPS